MLPIAATSALGAAAVAGAGRRRCGWLGHARWL